MLRPWLGVLPVVVACDVIVIADASNPTVDVPALTTGGRGLVDVTVEVAMLERPVHSGVYGGPGR